jgi:hypothetical protein
LSSRKTKTTSENLRRPLPAALAGLAILAASVTAQPAVPPQAVEQFEHTIGNRVEAVTILGGDYGAASGIYTFRGGNLADLSVSKVGGGGAVAASRPLGVGDVQWAPLGQANVGHITAENEFQNGYLAGNRTVYDVLAVQLGGGARFQLTDHLSLAPAISGIYAHTENEFKPRNAIGDAIQAAASGTYVDWEVDTWSVAPELAGRYEWNWGRTTFELGSRYSFYHTESFNSSSSVVGVNGDSQTWQNKLDVDAPLGWKLFGRELRTGGFFARTELFGNVARGLNEDHVYTLNGRFVMDLVGKVWKVRWLGAGVSYLWGDHFNGWTAGLDLRFQF